MSVQEVKKLISELNISPNKKMGQNFLVNESVIGNILQTASSSQAQAIIEVGPGLGALTRGLAKLSTKFSVVELDKKLTEFWRTQGVVVFHGDALKIAWDEVLGVDQDILLVSNLPYQISSSMVIKVSTELPQICEMILMFQKEVAQKIMAASGQSEFGMLSVLAQSFWQIENLMEVSPGSFFPAPKVASRVLRFQRKSSEIENPKKFLRFVKHCFQNKRKVVWKKIVNYSEKSHNKEDSLEAFGINKNTRAEEISAEMFIKLFEQIDGN